MSNISGPGGKPFDPDRFIESADADGLNSGPAQPSGPDACGIVKPTEDHIEVAQPDTFAQLIGASPYPQSSPGSEPAGKTIGNPPVQERQVNQQFIRDVPLEKKNILIGILAKPPSSTHTSQGPIGIITKPSGGSSGPIGIIARPTTPEGSDNQGPIYILARPTTPEGSDNQGPVYIIAESPYSGKKEGQGPTSILARPPATKKNDEQGPIAIVAMPKKSSDNERSGPMGIIGDRPGFKRLKV